MNNNNRCRLLLLLKYLYSSTDKDHMASVSELINILETEGINGNRNTIREDIKALNDAGFEVKESIGSNNSRRYFYGERLFDYDEMILLIEAVKSLHASQKKRKDLIGKLSMLISKHEAEKLLKAKIS